MAHADNLEKVILIMEVTNILGRVVKGVGGVFEVLYENSIYNCNARKKIRHNDFTILIGDFVEFDIIDKDKGVIESTLPRKNQMIRPAVSNIDQLFIVLAIEPEPDLILIDKLLANCFNKNIRPFIIINKTDISDNGFETKIRNNYQSVTDNIMCISALNKIGLEKIEAQLYGKVSCFTGQSAVGKSSILNAIVPELNLQTGILSVKVNRGKNTTRHTQLFNLFKDTFILDTPGFSLYDIENIKGSDLHLYYPDFNAENKCRFDMCTHTKEPNCTIITQVKNGLINKDRYDRYITIFNELIEKEDNCY